MKDAVLDIVVVNFRTPEDLAACLGSLAAYPPSVPHTVTVVHVCPEQVDLDVAEFFMSSNHHDAHWTEQVWETNVGYNIACNRAAADGEAPHIACFNADTRVVVGTLDTMRSALDENPYWAIAGPRQTDDRGQLTAAGIFGPGDVPLHRGWHEPSGDGRYTDVRDDCVTVSGAALFIRRSVWDELRDCPVQQAMFPGARGALGEQFHFYGETTCCYHARAHGHLLGYVGTTTMVHNHMGAGHPNQTSIASDRESFRRFCKAHELPHD